jgi:hypothetical protein
MDTPAPTDLHPGIDISDFLNGEEIDLYQSYIEILRWAVELGRIDLTHFASTMAKFSMVPREEHLTAIIRAYGCIEKVQIGNRLRTSGLESLRMDIK